MSASEFPIAACCDAMAVAKAANKIESFVNEERGLEVGVIGCCGGGCYVLSDLKFCPFCGVPITVWPHGEPGANP